MNTIYYLLILFKNKYLKNYKKHNIVFAEVVELIGNKGRGNRENERK